MKKKIFQLKEENLIGLNYMENQTNGEYEFILSDDKSITLRVQFKIDENGKILYDKPTFQ